MRSVISTIKQLMMMMMMMMMMAAFRAPLARADRRWMSGLEGSKRA